MGYFKDKIRQLVNWAQSDDKLVRGSDRGNYAKSSLGNLFNTSSGSNSIEGHNGGLNFTVYSATGGKVVQIRTYDPRTDQSRSTLYVVTDKEDLGHELGQIITVESLSR